MSGKNLATVDAITFSVISASESPCVFISYKSEDVEYAKAINDYLNYEAEINTYFDENDAVLKAEANRGNDELIVASIKRGLKCSSHLLCLVTDKTRVSWWVPYEIGFADSENKKITSLKFKDIDDVPSFLKINDVIDNVDQFLIFVSKLYKYGELLANKHYEFLLDKETRLLEKFLEKGE